MSSTDTMKAWAIKIEEEASVPENFQEMMSRIVSKLEVFPYTIFAPKNDKTGKPDQDTLLVMTAENIYVLEDQGGKISTASFFMKEIQMVQMGTVLLESWISIWGKSAGEYISCTLYFDTVLEELFEEVLNKIRNKALQLSPEPKKEGSKELDYLKEISEKFYNYGKFSLLPGQEIQNSAYQPMAYVGKSKNSAEFQTAPHLMILTEKEVILIEEAKQEQKSTSQKYSGVWSYIQIPHISNIEEQLEGEWMKLKIFLEGQKPKQIDYDPKNKLDAQNLTQNLKKKIQ